LLAPLNMTLAVMDAGTLNVLTSWSTLAKDSATAFAIAIGGIWALWKFVIRREARAKIQFSLELNVVGMSRDRWLVEATAVVENKGLVRHSVSDFRFDLHYLPEDAELADGDERINHQVLFRPVVRKRYWIPPNWMNTFVDAGVVQRYTYVTSLPGDAAFALLYAQFKYPDAESEFHTAQAVFNVRSIIQDRHDG
jgi:hypothetical protein